VRRLAGFLLRNWPLKLGAVLLASVLYSGLVLSQNVRTWTGTVPVDPIRISPDVALLSDPDPVTLVRFRAPLDIGVLAPGSFRATVDLSRVPAEEDAPPVSVPVTLIALDSAIQIVDFQPQTIQVRLDPVKELNVPVRVTYGEPEGVDVGPPQTEPSEVTARGASSRIAVVQHAEARVSIDASGISLDRLVELIPVDGQGNQVPNVQLEPALARVRIAVAQQLVSRTLPVVVRTVGDPAPGFRVTDVLHDPVAVTVSGDEAAVTGLEAAETVPIDITARESEFETTAAFNLPAGVSVIGPPEVRVTVTIAAEAGSRSYPVGVVLAGARSDRTYSLGATQVNVLLSGAVADLDAVDPTQILATAQVAELDVGSHVVPVNVAPPAGLELVGFDPVEVTVVVTAPLVTPTVPQTLPPASNLAAAVAI